jgi:hypothetical protein
MGFYPKIRLENGGSLMQRAMLGIQSPFISTTVLINSSNWPGLMKNAQAEERAATGMVEGLVRKSPA